MRDGLQGARIGVLRQLLTATAHPEVVHLFEQALVAMRRQGAEIVDPVRIPEHDEIPVPARFCVRLKFDLNAYLASLGPQAPMKSLEEVIASQKIHPSIEKRMLDAQAEPPLAENERCQRAAAHGRRLREGVLKVMQETKLDALVYPTWNNPPRLIGDLNSPHGNNSPLLSPPTGFPAITVPMGFVQGTLPAGLQFLGRAWSEPTLIKLAYAYEQATTHRRPPTSVPPLP